MVTAPRSVLAALALGCAIGLSAASRGAAQSALPKSSPFLPPAGTADAASAPGETLEFAAIRIIGQRTDIDLYDTQGKKNHWVPLGGTADGMTVVNYDAHRDQVVAKIGGVEKVLTLRQPRGVIAGNAAVVASPAMGFATPTPSPAPEAAPAPAVAAPVAEASANPTSVGPAAPAATPAASAAPAAPLSIARQEEEARMLVSDLLEIGMAQRKAYEEKQKQAADPNAARPPSQPTPAPAPNGPPTGG